MRGSVQVNLSEQTIKTIYKALALQSAASRMHGLKQEFKDIMEALDIIEEIIEDRY